MTDPCVGLSANGQTVMAGKKLWSGKKGSRASLLPNDMRSSNQKGFFYLSIYLSLNPDFL